MKVKSKSSHKEMQRQAKIAFFISNECKNQVSITRIWNRVIDFGTGSGYPVPAALRRHVGLLTDAHGRREGGGGRKRDMPPPKRKYHYYTTGQIHCENIGIAAGILSLALRIVLRTSIKGRPTVIKWQRL